MYILILSRRKAKRSPCCEVCFSGWMMIYVRVKTLTTSNGGDRHCSQCFDTFAIAMNWTGLQKLSFAGHASQKLFQMERPGSYRMNYRQLLKLGVRISETTYLIIA